MPKGRLFAPSTSTDGNWFQTRGFQSAPLFRDTSTSTGEMLTATFKPESSCRPARPPSPFNSWTRVTYEDENPFSLHDNRHSFQDHGVYFGHGLGKKLLPPEERQHYSKQLISWDKKDFFSDTNYYNSYQTRHCKNPPTRRRFPRIHSEGKAGSTKLDTTTTEWFKPPEVPHETKTQVLASSQEPFLKHNPWKYSYKASTARLVL
ncbi:testis-expressed protein 36-like [Saccoglossus kowalevskii]|uniref:Testis-expressed sequence 36 protein-like n=1 Tax=Saccoglossus kowalevskii TaxID=10224 RepID=A0ABM0GZ37_SACKO|nr:PREDICTED: testis-expressed sequence 36 protein-like [Saccoglossus kowalevskii]